VPFVERSIIIMSTSDSPLSLYRWICQHKFSVCTTMFVCRCPHPQPLSRSTNRLVATLQNSSC